MARKPVELTDSAKRKLELAKAEGLLGKGMAKKAASKVKSRKSSNKSAGDAARAILMRQAQSTDSHQ